jgi:chromate transporter
LFRETWHLREGPLSLDVPVPASLDLPAALLALAAIVAAFRFKLGMIPILIATSAAGVALHLLGIVT